MYHAFCTDSVVRIDLLNDDWDWSASSVTYASADDARAALPDVFVANPWQEGYAIRCASCNEVIETNQPNLIPG